MTDISVFTQPFQAEDLSWDLTPPDGGFIQQGVLDVSLFNSAQHYANGYIPSGTVVAIKTSGGKVGPYLDSLSNGQQTAVGILRASIQVLQPTGTAKTLVGVAYLVHGIVSVARLPFTSGTAALGGYIDAAGQTDLKLVYFAA